MLNNKLIKRVVTAENEGQEFVWLGKKQAESNQSIGLQFAVLGLTSAIVVRTLLFICRGIKGIWISSTTVYIIYVTESNERLFRIHLYNVFVAVINRLICCCAASQSSHRRFSPGTPPRRKPTVSETIQGCRNRRGFRF